MLDHFTFIVHNINNSINC